MEFLDNLVLPQSAEHLSLIHFLVKMVLMLFLPFVSILLGGTFLAWYYDRKGRKEGNTIYNRFAKDVIESVTVSKSVGVILGIVPLLTLILMYAQLLHTSEAITVTALTVSFTLLIISFILIYTYRYTFSFQGIVSTLDKVFKQEEKSADEVVYNDVKKYSSTIPSIHKRTGFYGFLTLLAASYFFVGGITVSLHPENWEKVTSIFTFFYSWDVISRFLYFITASMAITGGVILFLFFYWEGGKVNLNEEYKEFVKRTAVRVTFAFALFQPVFLIFNLWTLPANALSGSVFGLSVAGLFLIFISYHFLYAIIRNANLQASGYVFIVLILVFSIVIIKDQIAMGNATKTHNFNLNEKYLAYAKEAKGSSVAEIAEINGEAIYNTLCVACHQFENKLVGPPYKQVLPKYGDDLEKLANFIRNPVKVDPAYPPMPNQGLRPNEARAVATFMFEKYKGLF